MNKMDKTGRGGVAGQGEKEHMGKQTSQQVKYQPMLSTMRVINKVMRSSVWVGGWACIYQRLL